MKLRLSPQKIVVRISERQWQEFRSHQVLSERFWLSETKSIQITMKLADQSQYQMFGDDFVLQIAASDLKTPKSKKDVIWEILVGNHLTAALEIDLFSQRDAERGA